MFLSAILAAALHDFEHVGLTNDFLRKSAHPLALQYPQGSVLEQHHCTASFELMEKANLVFPTLRRTDSLFVRKLVTEMILATDLSCHATLMDTAQQNDGDYRQTLCFALHCADLSNCCRPEPVWRKWTQKIFEEYACQAEAERNLGLQVSTILDGVPSDFIDRVCLPLFLEFDRFLGSGTLEPLLANLEHNRRTRSIKGSPSRLNSS